MAYPHACSGVNITRNLSVFVLIANQITVLVSDVDKSLWTVNQTNECVYALQDVEYDLYMWWVHNEVLTAGRPLLTAIPSWSIMLREMVMEGSSRLCGGNWGVKGPLCWAAGSWTPWKGEWTSDTPRPCSISGGGVIGGISNSSSPKLGVWNVYGGKCREKNTVSPTHLRKGISCWVGSSIGCNLPGLNQTTLFLNGSLLLHHKYTCREVQWDVTFPQPI